MSGSSRSRPKPRLEPISLDELAGTTGMSGFGTLFTRDLSQRVPVLDHLDSNRSEGDINSLPQDPTALDSSAAHSTSGALEPARTSALDPTVLERKASALDPTAAESKASALEPPAATVTPAFTTVESSAPFASALDSESGAIAPAAPSQPSAPQSSALDFFDSNIPGYRRPKIRPAPTVQDGHSLAEQAVYDAMYKAGKPYQGESRILTIGL